MVKSMTSFGRSSSEEGKKRFFTVEMKSVNSRYLDINIITLVIAILLCNIKDKLRKSKDE